MGASLEKMLTLSDAVRITQPMRYNLMFKVVGPLCNLNCSYCYYSGKSAMYDDVDVMPLELLEVVIRDYIATNASDDIVFNWHGGEPLLAGLDYYHAVVKLQNKYRANKRISNTLQTNGILLDADMARFFRDNNFLIGISIDGNRDVHDKYRKDKTGCPTFDKVLEGIERLHRYDVDFNTMTAVSKASEGKGKEVYDFLKQIGSRYMQFMPVVEYLDSANRITPPANGDSRLAPWSVGGVEYGKFMCDIFDCWIENDVGKYFVNLFDSTLANWCGVENGCCAYSDTCGLNAVVEHNGDVYPCDHFVYPGYKLGNVLEKSVCEMLSADAMIRFGLDKRNRLPRKCLRCRFLFACRGECPKHRFDKTESGEDGLNCLCDGYMMFYSHAEPYMNKMKELLLRQESPSGVMTMKL